MSKPHAIRLPGILLDELKNKDYAHDDRFEDEAGGSNNRNGKGKKRKAPVNRKDMRKQKREAKKSKHNSNRRGQELLENDKKSHPVHSERRGPQFKDNKNEQNVVTLKNNYKKNRGTHEKLPFSSDDELSSGDFDDFDEDDLNEEEWEQLRELEREDEDEDEILHGDDFEEQPSSQAEGYSDFEGFDDDEKPMTAEETMERIKQVKESKKLQSSDFVEQSDSDTGVEEDLTVEETMAALKAMKQKKNASASSKGKTAVTKKGSFNAKPDIKDDKNYYTPLTPAERAVLERDEMDMKYYAKKLGLKGGQKRIRAKDDYDAIGGLLEGLDFFDNFGASDEEYGAFARTSENDRSDSDSESIGTDNIGDDETEEEIDQGSDGIDEQVENPFSSDDELSSGDFEEFSENDLDEDEWEQLRELEGTSSSTKRKVKENLYAPPISEEGATYVPPSLRKKQIDETDSEIVSEIRKRIKSALNKLSDLNTAIIVGSLNDLYDNFSRKHVNECLNNQIIEIVSAKNRLLDSFIMNYAGVVFSIWKLRGMESGASFIQSLVQTFLGIYKTQLKVVKMGSSDEPLVLTKEATNLITLLAYSYNFGLVSSTLIYDIIKELIKDPNEYTTELLLRIISVAGLLIRGDDPRALKDIITELLHNVKGEKQTTRMSFLLDTLSDLKNNRLKPSVLAPSHQTLKKNLIASLKISSTSSEPLLASLDDIINVDTKGKWWLIGASWKGNVESAFDEAKIKRDLPTSSSKIELDDDLLVSMPDWDEIARQQRMNTDVRRAIFISIMSAQDYMDAFTKIEKLNLKNKQAVDISRVLVHCLSNDWDSNGYNPYYSLLGSKLCENNHRIQKSFQFLFWEITKRFESSDASSDEENEDVLFTDDDLDEKSRLKRISNQGRFFGCLIADGFLKLDVFKHVPLMTGLSPDGILFTELLLFQLCLTVAKKSESKKKLTGNKVVEYSESVWVSLLEKGIKLENRAVILKAFKWFIRKHFNYKRYILGEKGSKEYERESRRINWAISSLKDIIDREIAFEK